MTSSWNHNLNSNLNPNCSLNRSLNRKTIPMIKWLPMKMLRTSR